MAAEASPSFGIGCIEDMDSIYLTPKEVWLSSLFQHYTMSVVSGAEADLGRYRLDLEELAHTVPEVQRVAQHGWQTAGYVGKLMTFSPDSVVPFAAEKSEKPRSIEELIVPFVGFRTGLFVVQPLAVNRTTPLKIEDVPVQDLPHLVAGVTNTGKKVLHVVQGDREESHYGYFGEYPTNDERLKPDGLAQAVWEDISALHAMLHNQTVEEIISGSLDRAGKSYS
jgi:hypothetical protein